MSTIGRAPARSVVSAEDIADNSINASKVIDGSIDIADLSSSVVTTTGTQTLTNKTLGSGVVYPAGHVLQTKTFVSTTSNGTSTSVEPSPTAGVSLGYVHITPIKANSLIWITATFSYNRNNNAHYQCCYWWLGYKIGTGNQSGTFTEWKKFFQDYNGAASSSSDDVYRNPTLNRVHDPSYTLGQTISYEWRIGAGRGSGSVGFPTIWVRNDTSTPPSWIGVQEIAQ